MAWCHVVFIKVVDSVNRIIYWVVKIADTATLKC